MPTKGPGGTFCFPGPNTSLPPAAAHQHFGPQMDWKVTQHPSHQRCRNPEEGSLDREGSRGSGELKRNLCPPPSPPLASQAYALLPSPLPLLKNACDKTALYLQRGESWLTMSGNWAGNRFIRLQGLLFAERWYTHDYFTVQL